MSVPVPLPSPPSWRKVPAGRLFVRQRRAPSADEEIVTAFRDGQVTARANRRTEGFTNAVQEIGYHGVRRGDLVIHSMDGFAGAIGVSDSDGKASPVVHAYWPADGVDARFFAYMLRTLARMGFVTSLARGIRERSTAFDSETFASLTLPAPAPTTQRAIADYLDRETARIDALIAAKGRMVELLAERRRSLRDHVFESEPGWRLKRLLATSMAYGVLVPEFVEAGTGVPMIRTYNLSATGRVDHEDIAEIPTSLAREYRRTSLCEGDVILSVVGSMGRSAVVGAAEHGFNLNRPLARLQLRADVPPRLIWHWIQTTHFMDMARLATGGGTAQPTLNLGDLANFTVGLPQATDRCSGILSTLEEACGLLDEIESVLGRQMDRLLERRAALITAAVTGQLDIPNAA